MSLLRVGILADDRLQQHMLSDCLDQPGIEVVINSDPTRFELIDHSTAVIDIWLAAVKETDTDEELPEWLTELLDLETPVLMMFDQAPVKGGLEHARWQKCLFSKMRDLVHRDQTEKNANRLKETLIHNGRPEELWVLGASLGGPAAVSEFLDALPTGLPVAFIYAQHIDHRFEQTLQKTIGRNSCFQLRNITPVGCLKSGEVLIAPIEKSFYFDAADCPVSSDHCWNGDYAPNINQVMQATYKCYGRKTGYILFSGMGNDGSEAIEHLSQNGVPFWAQSPETCANASMVESAIATQKISFLGSPTQLAQQLVHHLKNHGIRK